MKPQPKNKQWRSPKYLAWVRKQPCCICGKPDSVAHHIIGCGNMGGMGMKAPDWATMSLCVSHHQKMHLFHDMQGDQFEYITRTLGRAIDDGVLG